MVACVEAEEALGYREVPLADHLEVVELEVRGRPRGAAGLMEVWRLRRPLPGTLAADLVGYADCPTSGRRAALSAGPGLYRLATASGRVVEEWAQ